MSMVVNAHIVDTIGNTIDPASFVRAIFKPVFRLVSRHRLQARGSECPTFTFKINRVVYFDYILKRPSITPLLMSALPPIFETLLTSSALTPIVLVSMGSRIRVVDSLSLTHN